MSISDDDESSSQSLTDRKRQGACCAHLFRLYSPRRFYMAQKLVLFGSLLFVGLTAGAAYVVWFDYNPAGMSSTFYVQHMQHAIRVLTIPLPTIVVLGLLFTATASFQARKEPAVFYLLAIATACVLVVGLITRLGNIPINNQILTWKIESPPSDWSALAEKWWRFQTARFALQTAALCLVSLAALIRANQSAA